MTDARTRHRRGLAIVILLGVIFFTLLALIIVKTGKPRPPATQQRETLTVLPIRVRLRTEPSAKAPVVATAVKGDQLLLLEDRGAWVFVRTSDGLEGWAERSPLERTSERERRIARYEQIRRFPPLAGVTTERTPLYAGPGIFYPLVGELPGEADVKVFTRDHDFYAIEHDGQIAYADIDAIDVSASGSPQLDVATSGVPAPMPAPVPEVASTETTMTQEPLPVPTMPPPEPPRADNVGVYAAVPPGGTQPEEIDRVIPRYPAQARRAGAAGSVVIRGIVRKDGRIDEVEIIKDLPYGLGDAARDAVRRWRFRPATYRGDPIDVYYTVTVNFRLR